MIFGMLERLDLFAYALAVCFVRILGSDVYYFTKEPDPKLTAIDGTRLVLPCDVSDRDQIVFLWTFNDHQLENTTRRYQNHSDLVIDPVYRSRDAGVYQCTALNKTTHYSRSSRHSQLDVVWIGEEARVTRVDGGQEVSKGIELRLECGSEGSGFAVQWYRNSVKLVIDGRVGAEEKVLILRSVTSADNGIYSCAIQNDAGYLESIHNFALSVSGDSATPIIKIRPQDLVVPRNGVAQFDCQFDRAHGVEWRGRDELVIKNSSRRGVLVYPNGTLLLTKAKVGDEGPYTCSAISDKVEGPRQAYVAQLKFASLPALSRGDLWPKPNKDNRYIVKAGSAVEVLCRPKEETYPPASVYWMNAKGQNVSDGPFWIREAVQPKDAGSYSCVVETTFGKESFAVFLLVTVLPVITGEPSNVTLDEGSPLRLTCAFHGSPPPLTNLTWIRLCPSSSTPIPTVLTNSSGNKVTTQRDSKSQDYASSLTIAQATPVDACTYWCRLVSDGFEPVYSEPAGVTVREGLKFETKPVDQPLRLDEVEKVHCVVRGSKPAKVQWTKTSGALPSHVTAFSNGTLLFNKVKPSDEGQYVCLAKTASETLGTTVTLDVISPPRILTGPTPRTAMEKQTVAFDCYGTGDPKPVIHWSRENTTQPGNNNTRWNQMENGSLVIVNVRESDAGLYVCMMGNKGGLLRAEAVLTVQAEAKANNIVQTLIITICCAAGYFVVVGILIFYCKRRGAKKSGSPGHPMVPVMHSAPQSVVVPETQSLLAQNPSHSVFSPVPTRAVDSSQYTPRSASVGRPNMPRTQDDSRGSPNTSSAYSSAPTTTSSGGGAYYSRNQLYSIQTLGRGIFGQILIAGIQNCPFNVVLVKADETKDEELRKQLQAEMDLFNKMDHINVVKYVGMCRATRREMDWAMFEHSEAGVLWNFVRSNAEKISPWLQMDFAKQIAQGMRHIGEHKLVHRDLAARNCIVHVSNGQPIVKVSIANVLRNGHFDADYCTHRNRLLPIRWMPPEAVLDEIFSAKSDVWSFGVLCYEMLTRCQVKPYRDFSDSEVIACLETGTLELDLSQAQNLGGVRLIKQCLERNPKDRPTFAKTVDLWGVIFKEDGSSSDYQEIFRRA